MSEDCISINIFFTLLQSLSLCSEQVAVSLHSAYLKDSRIFIVGCFPFHTCFVTAPFVSQASSACRSNYLITNWSPHTFPLYTPKCYFVAYLVK